MQDFLKNIGGALKKGAGTIGDWLASEAKNAKEISKVRDQQVNTPTPIPNLKPDFENAKKSISQSAPIKTVADFFAPTPNVRVRDVARETVAAVPGVTKDIARGVAQFTKSAGEAIPMLAYEATTGKVPKATGAQTLPGPFGMLGPIETYQSTAIKNMEKGANPAAEAVKAVGRAAVEEPIGVAFKPLLALGMLAKGKGLLGKLGDAELKTIVESTKPEEIAGILTKKGLDAESAKNTAVALAKTTDKKTIESALKNVPVPKQVAKTASTEGIKEKTPTTEIIPTKKSSVGKAKNIIQENTADQVGGGHVATAHLNSFSLDKETGKYISKPMTEQYYRQTPFAGVPENILYKIKQGGGSQLKPEELKQLGKSLMEHGYMNDNTGMIVKGYGGNDIILGTTKINGQMEYIVAGIGRDGKLETIRLHGTHIGNDQIIGRTTKTLEELSSPNPIKVKEEIKQIPSSASGAKSVGEILQGGSLDKHGTLTKPDMTLSDPVEGSVYYHGTIKENKPTLLKEGFNIGSNKKGFAEQPEAFYIGSYGDASMYGDDIVGVRVKKGEQVKTISMSSQEWNETVGKSHNTQETADGLKELRKRGYDAVNSGNEIEILNPSKFETFDIKKEKTLYEQVTGKKQSDYQPPTGPIPGTQANASKEAERRFITRTGKLEPGTKPMLEGKYTPRSTAKLAEEADAIIAADREEAGRIAMNDTTDKGVAVASGLIDTYVNEGRAAVNEGAKNELFAKAAEIANAAAKNLTEHGRAIQAATLLGRLTPEGYVRYAAGKIQKYNREAGGRTLRNFLGGAKKIPELTGEQSKHIVDAMDAINKMTNPEEKARAFGKLSKEVQSWIPSSLYSKIISLWKAGLLTGIKTTGINIASNISHQITEIAKDIPAAFVDSIVKQFTGQRTLVATTKGEGAGLAEGVTKGWRYFRTGYDERDIAGKLDLKMVNFGKGKIASALQKYEETVFHLLGAEDQPFYYGAKARSLFSQAIATAKNEGLKGPAMKARIQELVASPTDDMLKYAVLDAQTAVFQNQTALGTAARAIQKLPGGEILLPFGKTPAAVATQLINYSPIGIAKTIIENIGKGRFDQRIFSQGMGRGITGTAALAIGMALYKNGMITTARPTSEKEQKQWQMEGKQPNAIKIGNTWRGVGVLGPIGMTIAVGAAVQEGIKETGSFIGGLGTGLAGAGQALTQQTFLSGINQAINAINDPTRFGGNFINNLVGSVVPTLIADVARATDTYERRNSTATERVKSRIPGLRTSLQPQVDVLGQKIKTDNFFEVMADPTRPYVPTEKLNDPVVLELRRMSDAGYPATPTMLGGTKGFNSLTPEQNTALLQMAGQYSKMQIQKAMATPGYRRGDDEKKQSLIEKAVTDAKTEARARQIYFATKSLAGAELNAKLSEMKDEKLLTKSVYDRYNSIRRFGR